MFATESDGFVDINRETNKLGCYLEYTDNWCIQFVFTLIRVLKFQLPIILILSNLIIFYSAEDSRFLYNTEECNLQNGDCDKIKSFEGDKMEIEPDYLPMSPGGPYSSVQANYVTMANLINNTHVSESVTWNRHD